MHSTTTKSQRSRGVIECYREFLPVSPATPIISLGEGNTPLIYSWRLSERVGRGCEVFVKNEGVNPTGSFKDRGMTVAVSKAMERGTNALICASTGNTSASAAAYATRAGISCVVILPDDSLRIVRELGETGDFTIVNSINPDRIAGQKTAAFEIVDDLGDAPDFHLLPVGNAGNITAYWGGYREYFAKERSTRLPVMIGFQAIGAAPIFHDRIIGKPETIASAIRIGNPASWAQARAAIVDSQGGIDVVSDEDILAAQSWLAQHEGIFVEPASAASIAGLFKCCDADDAAYSFKKIREASRIVCTVTGHGLKDPNVIIGQMSKLKPIAATVTDVRRAIRL
jgi:threonine synthase